MKHRIDEIYTAWPFYGSRKVTRAVRREGVVINRKTVERHMREMGIAGITPGPNLSRRAQEHRVFPYLLRNLLIERPNQVWGNDITYIRLLGGWLYLVAIIDWFSHYVLSGELDETLEMPCVMACVERALGQQIPEIWNSDQGAHFTAPQYIERFERTRRAHQPGRQRAGAGQHLHRTLLALAQVRRGLPARLCQSESGAARTRADYFDFYNHRRVHQALDYCTPAEVYFQTAAARQFLASVNKSTLTTKGKEASLNETLFLS